MYTCQEKFYGGGVVNRNIDTSDVNIATKHFSKSEEAFCEIGKPPVKLLGLESVRSLAAFLLLIRYRCSFSNLTTFSASNAILCVNDVHKSPLNTRQLVCVSVPHTLYTHAVHCLL